MLVDPPRDLESVWIGPFPGTFLDKVTVVVVIIIDIDIDIDIIVITFATAFFTVTGFISDNFDEELRMHDSESRQNLLICCLDSSVCADDMESCVLAITEFFMDDNKDLVWSGSSHGSICTSTSSTSSRLSRAWFRPVITSLKTTVNSFDLLEHAFRITEVVSFLFVHFDTLPSDDELSAWSSTIVSCRRVQTTSFLVVFGIWHFDIEIFATRGDV